MANNLVNYVLAPPAALLTLNRSEKRNALSRALIRQLSDAFELAKAEPAVRCVILTGAGNVFSAGMDLAELQASLGQASDESPVWQDSLELAKLYDLIYTFPKPTIAAVNGPALAGGAGLVTVCDLAIAAPTARIGYPEVRRGLVAAMVMPHLLRHVGERCARYLLLTGEAITAEEAERWGLVNEVTAADELIDKAGRWAKSIAEGGPGALEGSKALLRRFSHQSLSVEEAAKASAAPRLTQECQQGLRAFFEKRPAPWLQPEES